jgi:hypothetical protein
MKEIETTIEMGETAIFVRVVVGIGNVIGIATVETVGGIEIDMIRIETTVILMIGEERQDAVPRCVIILPKDFAAKVISVLFSTLVSMVHPLQTDRTVTMSQGTNQVLHHRITVMMIADDRLLQHRITEISRTIFITHLQVLQPCRLVGLAAPVPRRRYLKYSLPPLRLKPGS